jgi:hypothetical protein
MFPEEFDEPAIHELLSWDLPGRNPRKPEYDKPMANTRSTGKPAAKKTAKRATGKKTTKAK